jgi:hypothetical protein
MNAENKFFTVRGKTERRRKRDAMNQKKKSLLVIDRNELALSKTIRNLEPIPLKQPYQKGFMRTFILSERAAMSKNKEQFKEILNVINSKQYSLRKDFKVKKRKNRKKVWNEKVHLLNAIAPQCYFKLEKEYQKYFLKIEKHNSQKNTTEIKYVFAHPTYFKLNITPNIITHQRQVNATLETALKFITNKIERNNLHPKILNAKSKSYQYYYRDRDNLKHTDKYLQIAFPLDGDFFLYYFSKIINITTLQMA